MSVQVRPVAPKTAMEKSKNIYFDDILSKKECLDLETAFLDFSKGNYKNSNFEIDQMGHTTKAVNGPYVKIQKLNGYIQAYENSIFNRLTKQISEAFDEKVSYSHSYLRLYYNKSELRIHTDKDGLDITLSVNVGGLQNWAMHISKYKSNVRVLTGGTYDPIHKTDYESFITPKGCGIACYGVSPHWREKLVCADDEYVMQIFYHFTIIK